MDEQIVAIYCLCDDLMRQMGFADDPQTRMTNAEVVTTALVAALYFGGNFERARALLRAPRYMPTMLSRSRFNRRLHRVKGFFGILLALLGKQWKALNGASTYVIDTFPLPACAPHRRFRSRLYPDKPFLGYTASKKAHFRGLKLHLMVTGRGQPVEFFLTPGHQGDITGLKQFAFDLPPGATIYADKAYNDYTVEDALAERGLSLQPIRKSNSKRRNPDWLTQLQTVRRKVIETAGSLMHQLMPDSIHAVTPHGFELKCTLFVLGLSFLHWFKVAT
jgi:hypothetical protein